MIADDIWEYSIVPHSMKKAQRLLPFSALLTGADCNIVASDIGQLIAVLRNLEEVECLFPVISFLALQAALCTIISGSVRLFCLTW